MLDRILKISKHEAWMIFTNRSPIRLSSDVDVDKIIEIVMNDDSEVLEDTQVIELDDVA